MRHHTPRENLISALIGVVIFAVLFIALRPLYLKEQHDREVLASEVVEEWKVEEEEYAAQVAAEKLRWAEIETQDTEPAEEDTDEIVEYTLTAEDIEEEQYWDELSLLAEVVEAEAGGEDLMGKRLVVDVVLNRVDSDDYPDTITEVIYQDYQFSSVLDGGLDSAGWRMQEDDYNAVLMELEERTDSEILFFTAGGYGKYGTPAYKHGNHYFCY